jgi:hypothetical protein
MAYGMTPPPPLLGQRERRQPMGGLARSRPLQFAPGFGAANPQTGGTVKNRPIQGQRGAPRTPVRRRSAAPTGAPSGPQAPTQPIADPMGFPPLPEEVQDFEAAAGASRIPGVGQRGSERSVRTRRRRPHPSTGPSEEFYT